jgi:hypothetical protein
MEVTVGQFVSFLAPEISRRKRGPRWPPDAFAIAAALLQRSGAYARVTAEHAAMPRVQTVIDTGKAWRNSASHDKRNPPQVEEWWKVCRSAFGTPISRVQESPKVTAALLGLTGAADEASAGIGVPSASEADLFEFRAIAQLLTGNMRTLCREIDPSRAIVLPKTHTPQNGITVRSLSHHLALYLPGEVLPNWKWAPTLRNKDKWKINLLLLPWPLEVQQQPFRDARANVLGVPDRFGFFDCGSGRGVSAESVVVAMRSAENCLNPNEDEEPHDFIDAIVFPERSLRRDDPAAIATATDALVIGGVGEDPAAHGEHGRNYSAVVIPPFSMVHKQQKQHRWVLDRTQLLQYSDLKLDGSRAWWENIAVSQRELSFFSMNDWLTFSVLICEDLARPDPSTDLVRCVGPNLVIALLMDGPQLKSRWSARYATVLADDPGCSVLTLTSLGMALACGGDGQDRLPIIALWKDSESGAREIHLESGAIGVVLTLEREPVPEWTVGGRKCGNRSRLIYRAVKQVPDTTATKSEVSPPLDSPTEGAPYAALALDESRLAMIAYCLVGYRHLSVAMSDEVFESMKAGLETDSAKELAVRWRRGQESSEGVAVDIWRWAEDVAVPRGLEIP